MMSRHPVEFDRSRLALEPLSNRKHDLHLTDILPLKPASPVHPSIKEVASRILEAKKKHSAVILMMGAHVIRSGVQRYLIDLMERGYVSCIATNGAGVIHDFEFSLIGSTTESVSRYIKNGRFGLWKETGLINDIVSEAAKNSLGLGEAVGAAINNGTFPHRDISVLAAGFRLRIPVTVHVSIGYDIVHELPNCDGSSYGATSYRDFLRFTNVLAAIEGGVLMNFGSAIMGPEIYLKALSMVRNVSRQEGRRIREFTTLVCDLRDIPADFRKEPEKSYDSYFFRPWKTMLVRTISDEGKSFYVRAPHRQTIPQLWSALAT